MLFTRQLRPATMSEVQITGGFWQEWQQVICSRTLFAIHDKLVETGRLENFRAVTRGENRKFEGFRFNDSDVYKWQEACAYGLAVQSNDRLWGLLDESIQLVEAAQMPDGYLNTFFQIERPEMRWKNLSMMHEMYCGGHLIEAGVALFECLGDRRLLDVGIRFADHVMSIFGPGKRFGYCGHQEMELALIRLGNATGEGKYREFARWMVESRGSSETPFKAELTDEDALSLSTGQVHMLQRDGQYRGDYAQDHAPIREHREVVGHAVRAMYFYTAATELADDEDLQTALHTIWKNLTERRMYVTGGIGSSGANEGFTADYDLPNLHAYAETCAAIGLVFWARSMGNRTADAEYFDILEKSLFNSVLSGISLSGDEFFYDNPLESRGAHPRQPWFSCACCPPNVARLIGSIGTYFVSVDADEILVHVPASLTLTTSVNGVTVKLIMESNYPWSGDFTIAVHPERDVEFTLSLRVPGWCSDATFEVLGSDDEADYRAGYASFTRTWTKEDVVICSFEMSVQETASHPHVLENAGKLAVERGPLVYCLEAPSISSAPQRFALDEIHEPIISNGVTVIPMTGRIETEVDERLYLPWADGEFCEEQFLAQPYYRWANEGPSYMLVWLRSAS
ncbi:MAG: glycoside hydrolase family 127 protein [Fimbriimonadaceae bacterium]